MLLVMRDRAYPTCCAPPLRADGGSSVIHEAGVDLPGARAVVKARIDMHLLLPPS